VCVSVRYEPKSHVFILAKRKSSKFINGLNCLRKTLVVTSTSCNDADLKGILIRVRRSFLTVSMVFSVTKSANTFNNPKGI
jgi:hypothetical protein